MCQSVKSHPSEYIYSLLTRVFFKWIFINAYIGKILTGSKFEALYITLEPKKFFLKGLMVIMLREKDK